MIKREPTILGLISGIRSIELKATVLEPPSHQATNVGGEKPTTYATLFRPRTRLFAVPHLSLSHPILNSSSYNGERLETQTSAWPILSC